MSNYYFDTSALAKRYLAEIGSAWVRGIVRPSSGHVIMICDVTPIEMFSLLARRQRQTLLTPANTTLIQTTFLKHVEQDYLVTFIDSSILTQARHLITRHKLRTLDAIQLACALDAAASLGEAITFVAADVDLLAAASAEGFAVDDPNAHP